MAGALLGPLVGAAVGSHYSALGAVGVTALTELGCVGAGAALGAGLTKGVELKLNPGITMDLVIAQPSRLPDKDGPPIERLVFISQDMAIGIRIGMTE